MSVQMSCPSMRAVPPEGSSKPTSMLMADVCTTIKLLGMQCSAKDCDFLPHYSMYNCVSPVLQARPFKPYLWQQQPAARCSQHSKQCCLDTHIMRLLTHRTCVRQACCIQAGLYLPCSVGAQQPKALPPAHCHAQIPHRLLGRVAILHHQQGTNFMQGQMNIKSICLHSTHLSAIVLSKEALQKLTIAWLKCTNCKLACKGARLVRMTCTDDTFVHCTTLQCSLALASY